MDKKLRCGTKVQVIRFFVQPVYPSFPHMQPLTLYNQKNLDAKYIVHHDLLGPASSSVASAGWRFPRRNSPSVLLKLLVLVTPGQLDLSWSKDLLARESASCSGSVEFKGSSTGLCEPDLDRRRLEGRRLIGDSMFRLKESTIITLSPPESGDNKGPGIIREIECLAGVYGRTGSAWGTTGPCC